MINMNKKLIVKNEFQKTVYCVLSDEKPYKEQLMIVLSLNAGCGYTVAYLDDKFLVKDYRTNETVGTFHIISFTDTQEDVVLNWQSYNHS